MFNIYSYEKKKHLEESALKNQIKFENRMKKLKEKRKEMSYNYEKRIKNFIYEMANKPITINNYQSPIENSRKEFLHENGSENVTKKNFVFTNFKTDQQRMKDYENKKLVDMKMQRSRSQKTIIEFHDSNAIHEVVQPHMKFKHRTELERIYDAINDYSYGRADKEVIRKQLKSMNLYKLKRLIPKEEVVVYSHKKYLEQKYDANSSNHQPEKEEYFRKKLEILENLKEFIKNDESLLDDEIFDNKNKNAKKKYIDNSMSKYLMKDLHLKTHFKAASMYMYKDDRNISNNNFSKLTNSNSSLNLLVNNGTKINKEKQDFDLSPHKDEIYDKNINKFQTIQENRVSGLKPLMNNLDFNPVLEYKKKEKREIAVDKDKLYRVQQLAHPKKLLKYSDFTYYEESHNNLNEDNFKRDEEKVYINGEGFYKSQTDLIANRVLKKCNFIASKSPYNNNMLKIGKGKLAMTSGLTISEFTEKYKIPK